MTTRVHVQDRAGNGFYLLEADGTKFPDFFTDDPVERLNEIRNMPGRNDDVLIAAYPKAGTHWVWEITNMLLRGSAEYHPSGKEEQMIELRGARGADQLPSPRVFNTHLLLRQLPKDMVARKCKILYLTRNPKDMVVSRYYHTSRDDPAYDGTFSDYFPLYMNGQVAFGSWFDYTLDWNTAMQDNREYPVHTASYEDLKRDSVKTVQKLAEFLGARSDETFVREVCDMCSFNNLKSSYHTKHIDKLRPTEYAFRKGEIGDWKNWFTVAMNEQFDAAIRDRLKAHKHAFIYE